MHLRRGRRAGFCRRRLTAGAAERATRLAVVLCAVAFTVIEADLDARGLCQSWPGGGCRSASRGGVRGGLALALAEQASELFK